MDLERLIDEVYQRIIDKTKQEEITKAVSKEAVSKEAVRPGKKFLQCEGKVLSIAGYEAVLFETIKDKSQFRDYQFLVITRLSIDEMAASVSGLAINEKTRVLRQFLLTGKTVYVMEEGLEHRAYKAIANPVFYNVFKDQETKLIQYGMQIMSAIALETALDTGEKMVSAETIRNETVAESAVRSGSNAIQSNEIKSSNKYTTVKKLINHELAKQLASEANITLKVGTLITPYANDVFRESNTRITFI